MNLKKSLSLLCFLLAGMTAFSQAVPFTVWPGDANHNGITNHFDILYHGIGFGSSGPQRDSLNQGVAWQAFVMDTAWGPTLAGGTDYAHLDCDGNGSIDSFDANTIQQNMGLVDSITSLDSTSPSNFFFPSLSLQFQLDTIPSNTTIIVPLVMGTPAIPIDSIYGLALTLTYDTTLVKSIGMDFTGSILSGGGSFVIESVTHNDRANQMFHVGVTRTNQLNTNGNGSVGNVIIVLEDNLKKTATVKDLSLKLSDVLMITASETIIGVNPMNDTIVIISGKEEPQLISAISLFPNPANDLLNIISDAKNLIQSVSIYALDGKLVKDYGLAEVESGELNLNGISSGMYFIKLESSKGILTKKIIINKQ